MVFNLTLLSTDKIDLEAQLAKTQTIITPEQTAQQEFELELQKNTKLI
jgi:hypothetical protein